MNISFVDNRDHTATHIVRVMSPMGIYPSHTTIINSESALYISPQICFSISPVDMLKLEIDGYYSEVEWASLNEIRLFASILLSVDREFGYCRLFPLSVSHKLRISNNSLTIEWLELLANHLIKELASLSKIGNTNCEYNSFGSYKRLKGVELPTAVSGIDYVYSEGAYNLDLQTELYHKFNIQDYLMVRAVSTLIRSFMLGGVSGFLEETINTTFISLDASQQLILNLLKEQGNKNPSTKDVARYMEVNFNMIMGDKFFIEYYESRIMSFHPSSRFGIFPHAPLMADDHIDLADDLIKLYCFLICGYIKLDL